MFTVNKGIDEEHGYEVLAMTGAGHEARILPCAGFNLFDWRFEGKEILMKPVDITIFGTKYGIPILFPAPNRIKDATYVWRGKRYVMTKRGKKIMRHGLVSDEPFALKRLEAREDCAVCEAEIAIAPGGPLYEGYPFACTLTVCYTLDAAGLHFSARVHNDGEEDMPFGLALHPYFSKRGDAKRVFIKAPVRRVYACDAELIPSGELLDAEGGLCIWDGFHDVEGLYLDNVYRGMTADMASEIRYEDITVSIRASDCFRNLVVFTPHDRPGFCIEPQTNATDAFNLHARGLVDESGLLILPAGQTFEGTVDFAVEKR
ncbi:MAG: aldose 1-epimerase [Clostridia bacterium]|nr:aldose 1-epimerase [Clostridia bacterium]